MPSAPIDIRRIRPSLHLILLGAFLLALWIAGGASRADALGQAVVRSSAVIILICLILLAPRPRIGTARPVALFLGGSILLCALQLVPLPPGLWQSLPGRDLIAQAAIVSGQLQPWRPIALMPSAALNALISLIVPLTTLWLLAGLKDEESRYVPTLLLGLIAASTLVGLLQFSGGGFDNPLINESVGAVSGSFANRNHFALFLAFGCLITPVWVFAGGKRRTWRAALGTGLIALFLLTILASGSRTGMVLGAAGLALGCALAWNYLRRELSRYRLWIVIALAVGIAVLVGALILLSVHAERAVAIDRLLSQDVNSDFRTLAFPTVMTMVSTYFPIGSGFGGFGDEFRIFEPFSLLKRTYYNHAHNDWLEIVLDGGLPGLLLLVVAVGWWCWVSFKVWFGKDAAKRLLPKLGSALLLLVFVASVFDYPARTPMVMAIVVIAAVWLSGVRSGVSSGTAREDRTF